MIYRILKSPPGYPEEKGYMVVRYSDLTYESCLEGLEDKTRFFETIEDARRAIPSDARKVEIPVEFQFLECWSSDEH